MKKTLATLLSVILLAAMFVGCTNQEDTKVEGILKSFSGSLVEVSATNGDDLIFSVEDGVINTTHGMVAGDDIVIHYVGEIKGTDTSGATVISIEDRTQHDLPKGMVSGSLVDFTLNTVTLTDSFGVTYTFTTTMADMDLYNGLAAGNYIEVYYEGVLHDPKDTSDVNVYRVVDKDTNKKDDPEPAPAPTPEPKPEPAPGSLPIHSADPAKQPDFGIVFHNLDNQHVWATAYVNIYVGPGTNYSRITGFGPGDETIRTGYSDNGWSRVFLDGYTAYCQSDYLTGIPPAPPTPPKPKPTVNIVAGYVLDGTTMNDILMRVQGVGDLDIYPDDKTERHYVDGICIGDYITVEYTGTIHGLDTSKIKVLTITDRAVHPVPEPEPEPEPEPTPEPIPAPGPVKPDPDPEPAPEPEPEPTPEPEPAPEPVVEPGPVISPAPENESNDHPLLGEGPALGVGAIPTAPTVYGTVTGTTGNTVTMKTDDGATITFSITDSTKNHVGDLSEGQRIGVQLNSGGSGNVRTALVIASA